MKENLKHFKASSTFIICLLILPLYIYLYKHSLNIFWVLFFGERLISPLLEKKLEGLLDTCDEEDTSMGGLLLFLLIFSIIAIGFLIFILFKYPKLFVLIMIGELIDKIIKKLIS